MAEIVGGFIVSHDPMITGNPEIANKKQVANVDAAFERIVDRLKTLNVDTVIVIGDDHYTMFGPHCLPQYLIGVGDLEGPEEDWLRIDRYVVENNVPLAEHIMNYGFANGFDWAVAKSLLLDHGTMIPIHKAVTPIPGVRAIPIYLAAAVTPIIPMRRAQQLGEMIGDAVNAWDKDERVAVFGCGGISHWVGTAEMGKVNEEFDHMILNHVNNGDIEALIALGDDYILENGGNGAWEIRNWVCAMSAMKKNITGETICYEPMPTWITGIGFSELKVA